MKKIIIVFALLLLAGCCGFLSLGGSKDELELVPITANAVVIAQPSAILNDSDISLQTWQNMPYDLNRIQETSGVDLTKIDRVVLFLKFDSLSQQTESYGGFIARGTLDQNKILENMRVDNYVTETSYAGQKMYEMSSKQAPENKTYFAFLDDSTLVGGTKEAVQDSIDTNSGKMESMKSNGNLTQTYDMLDKNSLVMFFMQIPPNMKSEIRNSNESINTEALSHANSFGMSLLKDGKAVEIKLLVVAEDASSANDISDLFNKALSSLKGIVPSGSTTETVVKKLEVNTKGNVVTLSLLSTADQLKSMRDELLPQAT